MSFLIKLLCCLHNRRINSSVVYFFFSWKMHSWFNVYSCFMIYSRTCHLFWHVKNIHIHIFFPLSILFGIFDCYSVILVQERRHYDLSFLVLCCCLIIFFFYLEITSSSLNTCSNAQPFLNPFLSLSLSFTVATQRLFDLCLFIDHSLFRTACCTCETLITLIWRSLSSTLTEVLYSCCLEKVFAS